MENIGSVVEVSYKAFQASQLDDSEAYVHYLDLIPWDSAEGQELITWDGDDPIAAEGYLSVSYENGHFLVKQENAHLRVYPADALSGGWGYKYPAGGMSSHSVPDAVGECDGEEVFLSLGAAL